MRRVILTVMLAAGAATSASGGILYAVDDGRDLLFTIDTDLLTVTPVGSLGTGGDFGDLAYDNATGTMFYVGGRGNDSLYTVNLATGAATLVGAHGVSDMFALGVDDQGQLYGQATSGQVYRLDRNTGGASGIGSNSVYPGGYDWTPGVGLVFIQAGGGDIFSVDRNTGAATLLASPGGINDCDIAYDPDKGVHWAADWSGNLFQYDGAWNQSMVLSGLSSVAALEYVPAPSALAVLGLGGLTAMRRRR
ncbi:MAG TPA: hypothetical protein VFF69_02965 [Phycisphaerales bacterium]|nr:hypothetical protein [Phycisphaerales bacterium]